MKIWISQNEIDALPTSGGAWAAVQNAANVPWGAADLSNNNSPHDVLTLAGALVAARTGSIDMRLKTAVALRSAMDSKFARALELSRGLQTYIIAADIINFLDPAFMDWVDKAITAPLQGHSGGTGIIGTAERSPTNWGGNARASLAAAALYLGREDWLQSVVTAHKAFIGLDAPANKMKYGDTNWHAGSPQAGINASNATRWAVILSGVLPEDWRRGGEYKWPPAKSGYMWGGMQGLVTCAAILHRAGLVSFDAGDYAIVRAMDMLYGVGYAASNNPVFRYPAEGDDTWVPWVVNAYAGTTYPTTPASPGKGMGWTDWTHAKAGTAPPVEPPIVVDPPVEPPVDPPPTEETVSIRATITVQAPVGQADAWRAALGDAKVSVG